MILIPILISACWLVFFIFWLINASSTKKTLEKQSTWSRLFYKISVIVSYILILEGINNKQPLWLNFQIIPSTFYFMVLGLIITILGLFIAIWARISLGTNWSGNITLKKNHSLVTNGSYRLIRHPIYSGILLMAVGTFISIGTFAGIIGLLILFISFFIKLRSEEKLMIKHLRNEYIDYKKRTKMLIPYLI